MAPGQVCQRQVLASTISLTRFRRPWQTAMAVIAAFLARSPSTR
jgi:hypothetical protein